MDPGIETWVADSETGLFIFPFWKRGGVAYLQNNFISQDKPFSWSNKQS
jgi:hypothetical protein